MKGRVIRNNPKKDGRRVQKIGDTENKRKTNILIPSHHQKKGTQRQKKVGRGGECTITATVVSGISA